MAGSRLFLHGSQQTPLPPASRKNSDSPVSHSSSWVGISGTKANHPQDERHEEGVEAAVVAAFFGWYCQALFYISVGSRSQAKDHSERTVRRCARPA